MDYPLETGGIFYKDGSEKIISTGAPQRIKNLDELPFPAFDKLDMPAYFNRQKRFALAKSTPYISIVTSRGCPGRCIFCSKSVYGSSFYARSPENILSEIENNVIKYNIREVRIMDDCFAFNRARVIKFCQNVIQSGMDLNFALPNGIRINDTDEELLLWMKKAGFYMIFFGIESADQKILDNIKKDCSVDLMSAVVKLS